VRPEPNPPGGRKADAWQDPPADLARTSTAPTPPTPVSSQPAPSVPASREPEAAKAAQDQATQPEAARSRAPSLARARHRDEKARDEATDSAGSKAPAPTPNKDAATNPAPARTVKAVAAREDSSAAETEAADRPARRNLRHAARRAPALAIRAKTRVKVVTARSEEEPAKVVKRRVRLVRAEEPEASRPAVHLRHAPRRMALRQRVVRNRYAAGSGLRVSSVQTYYLPDGRRVTVNVMPQPNVVRELAAYHAATFSGRRAAAAPSWGAPSWGGDWFGSND
jgi:hypothetical protein